MEKLTIFVLENVDLVFESIQTRFFSLRLSQYIIE